MLFLVYVADYFYREKAIFERKDEYETAYVKMNLLVGGCDIEMPWSFEKMGLPLELGTELEAFTTRSHQGRPYDRGSLLGLLNALRNINVHFYEMHTNGEQYQPRRDLRRTYDRRHLQYLLGDRLCELCGKVVEGVLTLRLPKFHPPVHPEMMNEPF
jgi:hypothetical protein